MKNTNPKKVTKNNGKQILKKIEIMKDTCKQKKNKSRDINKSMSSYWLLSKPEATTDKF